MQCSTWCTYKYAPITATTSCNLTPTLVINSSNLNSLTQDSDWSPTAIIGEDQFYDGSFPTCITWHLLELKKCTFQFHAYTILRQTI